MELAFGILSWMDVRETEHIMVEAMCEVPSAEFGGGLI